MKIVKVGVFHKVKKAAKGMLNARSGIALMTLANHASYYGLNLGIGSPGQESQLLLDTGSGSMWMLDAKTHTQSSFDPSKSSTFENTGEEFNVGYVTSKASGSWVTDQIEVGPFSIPKMKFGLVNTTDQGSHGILGVGFSGAPGDDEKALQNLPTALVKNGDIKKQVFSLYLDSLKSSTGSIIFGGMDASKYTGDLWKIPLTNKGAFEIELTSMKLGNMFYKLPSEKPKVRVDSGSSYSYLPRYIVDQIGKQVGAKYNEQAGIYFISSDDLNKQGNPDIEFSFNGAVIKVPASEAFPEAEKFMNNPPKDRFLAILDDKRVNGLPILGDVFLRSCYAVFDVADRQMALGQARLAGSDEAAKPNYYEITGPNIPYAKDPPGDPLA